MDRVITRRNLIGRGVAVAATMAVAGTGAPAEAVENTINFDMPPRWNLTDHWIDTVNWGYPYIGNLLDSVMDDASHDLAMHRGWMRDRIPNDDIPGAELPCPSDEDLVLALMEPVPLAVAYHDLCVGLAIPVPEKVQQAFDALRPVAFRDATSATS